jgi:hypothetical protein
MAAAWGRVSGFILGCRSGWQNRLRLSAAHDPRPPPPHRASTQLGGRRDPGRAHAAAAGGRRLRSASCWARAGLRDLLAGHGWPVHKLPGHPARERVQLLRRLKREARADGAPAAQALCLPDSFSSALEFRLAGLPALGHAWEGRRLLLARAVPRPQGVHELDVYWRLGSALLDQTAPLPERVGLRLAPATPGAGPGPAQSPWPARGWHIHLPLCRGHLEPAGQDLAGFRRLRRPGTRRAGPSGGGLPRPGRGGVDRAPSLSDGPPAARRRPGRLRRLAARRGPDAVQRHRPRPPGSRGRCATRLGDGPKRPQALAPLGPGHVQVLGGHGAWPPRAAVLQAIQARLARR